MLGCTRRLSREFRRQQAPGLNQAAGLDTGTDTQATQRVKQGRHSTSMSRVMETATGWCSECMQPSPNSTQPPAHSHGKPCLARRSGCQTGRARTRP
eukprot:scaffold97464_cov17-Tisochrysis_lutea.AAC.1